jgi:hypothetical protein
MKMAQEMREEFTGKQVICERGERVSKTAYHAPVFFLSRGWIVRAV